MNQQEFNKKFKDYIEEGYQGLCFDIPECTEYLNKILTHIIEKQPDFKLRQIKGKFNRYCFYSNLPIMTENEITKKLLEIHPL